MKKLVWHKGSPPHIGWWAASVVHKLKYWRWWNGKNWSLPADKNETAEVRERFSRTPSFYANKQIEWCDYWPENARVPRIDPRKSVVLLASQNND